VRLTVPVFAAALMVTTPGPDPEAPEITFSQLLG
jgi:hypothetical protein